MAQFKHHLRRGKSRTLNLQGSLLAAAIGVELERRRQNYAALMAAVDNGTIKLEGA